MLPKGIAITEMFKAKIATYLIFSPVEQLFIMQSLLIKFKEQTRTLKYFQISILLQG